MILCSVSYNASLFISFTVYIFHIPCNFSTVVLSIVLSFFSYTIFQFLIQLLMEAPDDILCFEFNPSDPNVIAGGCINGQVKYLSASSHGR